MTLLQKYVEIRPLGVPYRERGQRWLKLTDAVNAVDSHERPVCKKSVAENFQILMDKYKPFFEYETSQRSDSMDMEMAAHSAYQVVRLIELYLYYSMIFLTSIHCCNKQQVHDENTSTEEKSKNKDESEHE